MYRFVEAQLVSAPVFGFLELLKDGHLSDPARAKPDGQREPVRGIEGAHVSEINVGFDVELGRPRDSARAIKYFAAHGLSVLVPAGGIGQVSVHFVMGREPVARRLREASETFVFSHSACSEASSVSGSAF